MPLGLIASFCINLFSLIIYRYKMGTKKVIPYFTSRLGTLVLCVIMLSCFIFLAIEKPHGTALWASVTGVVLFAGMMVAKRRAPEIKEIGQGDSEMEMIFTWPVRPTRASTLSSAAHARRLWNKSRTIRCM